MNPTRINLWSGPRNISTALMYSFAQRKDTTVFDEPLYAHYLSKTKAKEYHPGADEIIRTMENDGNKVVDMMLGNFKTQCTFFKHMSHHVVELDWGFMKVMSNVILTRDPHEMLISFVHQIEKPTLQDVGYAKHIEIVNYLRQHKKPIIVLDGKNVLLNPKKVLGELCEQLQISFDEAMLEWSPGARPEDGCWAKYWYQNVHQSNEFGRYKKKETAFPDRLKPLLEECLPLYNQLREIAIQP